MFARAITATAFASLALAAATPVQLPLAGPTLKPGPLIGVWIPFGTTLRHFCSEWNGACATVAPDRHLVLTACSDGWKLTGWPFLTAAVNCNTPLDDPVEDYTEETIRKMGLTVVG